MLFLENDLISSNQSGLCSKIDFLFVTFLVTLTNVEINFDQYLQLTSQEKSQEKMLSIDISHIYGGNVGKFAQV